MQEIFCNRTPSSTIPSRLGTVTGKLAALSFGLGTEYIELRHVLEPFPAPILITTADASIIYVNSAWEELTGYSLEEVEGKNPRIFKSGKTDKTIFKKMWKTLNEGNSFTTEKIIDKRKDGSDFYINSIIFPIRKNQETLFYVQLELDITNRKKLEDLKREFLSTATHELKTPITTLKLMIESEIRKIIKKEFTKINLQELQLINRELDRLTNIINDLSDVSRIEAGKMRMEMKVIDIVSLITDTAHQMKTIAKGHKIQVNKSPPVYVIADESRIKQVLINLIKNALKYSYPKSKIQITTTIHGRNCIVSVENEGVGIPRNKRPYIFDRFFQLETGNSTGMGLGLYISKKIIEQHKGKVWLQSREGKLTTFYFSLVLADKKSEN